MDWLTRPQPGQGWHPLLLWIKTLEVLAVVLLAVALLTLVVGWCGTSPGGSV